MKRRLQEWLFTLVPIWPMAIARVIIGGSLFLFYLRHITEIKFHFIDFSFIGEFNQLSRFQLFSWLSDFFSGHPSLIVFIYFLTLLSSFLLTIGFRSTISGTLTIILHLFLVGLNPLAYWGWADLAPSFLAYVLLAKGGGCFTYKDLVRIWRGRESLKAIQASLLQTKALAWPMRLLQAHCITMYLATSLPRFAQPDWLNGNAIVFAFDNWLFSRFLIDATQIASMIQPLSYVALIIEPLALALIIKKLRKPIALTLIAMHILLELFFNVGWWNFLMMAGLFTFLIKDSNCNEDSSDNIKNSTAGTFRSWQFNALALILFIRFFSVLPDSSFPESLKSVQANLNFHLRHTLQSPSGFEVFQFSPYKANQQYTRGFCFQTIRNSSQGLQIDEDNSSCLSKTQKSFLHHPTNALFYRAAIVSLRELGQNEKLTPPARSFYRNFSQTLAKRSCAAENTQSVQIGLRSNHRTLKSGQPSSQWRILAQIKCSDLTLSRFTNGLAIQPSVLNSQWKDFLALEGHFIR